MTKKTKQQTIKALTDELNKERSKEYIVVEVSDRNFHLCKKQLGNNNARYKSMMNGRSKRMVEQTCDTLNEKE